MRRPSEAIVVAIAIVAGFVLRLYFALRNALDPDEASFFFLALPRDLAQLYHSGALTHHPPLLIFVLHAMIQISTSEVALRALPVLAGTLAPLIVYLWLGRLAHRTAGLIAMLVLAFSPNLILVGAQARGYTLALFFCALAIFLLDEAIEKRSPFHMALFTAALYLAAFSEYSVAWFAAAAGVYFLLRIRSHPIGGRLIALWAAGQAGALAIYGVLYWTAMRSLIEASNKLNLSNGFEDPAFPKHGGLLYFGPFATVRQFVYVFASVPAGIVAALLFGMAVVWLWTKARGGGITRDRALVTFLVIPFALGYLSAVARIHPYGRTRHTLLLALFIAPGFGLAIELLGNAQRWLAWTAILIIPLLLYSAEVRANELVSLRQTRAGAESAVNYIRSSIPPGSLVLTEAETAGVLHYYMRKEDPSAPPEVLNGLGNYFEIMKIRDHPIVDDLGPIRIAWFRWSINIPKEFLEDSQRLRREFNLLESQPLWAVDGGNTVGLDTRMRSQYPAVPITDDHNFDNTMIVFRLAGAGN